MADAAPEITGAREDVDISPAVRPPRGRKRLWNLSGDIPPYGNIVAPAFCGGQPNEGRVGICRNADSSGATAPLRGFASRYDDRQLQQPSTNTILRKDDKNELRKLAGEDL